MSTDARDLRERDDPAIPAYHSVLDSIDTGYCEIEVLFDDGGKPVDYVFLAVNPSFEQQTGLQDAVGRRMRDLAPAHEEHWFEIYGRVAVSGQPTRFQNEARALGRWYEVFASRLGGEDSRRVAVLFTDITDGVGAERRLQASEERYRLLFESTQDGILILDACTLRILDANPCMCELLEYSREELNGMEVGDTGLFQESRQLERFIEELRDLRFTRHDDLSLVNRSGKTVEIEITCNIYRAEDHEYIQCNIRNISGRKRLERQIREQANDLAESGRRKDEFLAMLSHELRNPLAPVFSALQLMEEEGYVSETQREAGGIIRRQMRHLSRIVNDLLEISRITTGRIALRTRRVDLNQVVVNAVERLRPNFESRRQVLHLNLMNAPVWLEADAARLEQVVGNLLHNASKYNRPRGNIWAAVEVGGDHARVRVRDDGVGIEPELLPSVFELFTQWDRSLGRTKGGMGIGLALVRNLVELHGGYVEAFSGGSKQGSEFIVWLPLAPAAAQRGPSASADDSRPSAGMLKVLVVDDHKDTARMSMMLLRSWGHHVRVANTGLEALEQARDFHPQVVLLDIGLPDLDGYEVARRIRNDPDLQAARLVAITGYGQASDRATALEAGYDQHMVKPVEPADLKKALAGLRH